MYVFFLVSCRSWTVEGHTNSLTFIGVSESLGPQHVPYNAFAIVANDPHHNQHV